MEDNMMNNNIQELISQILESIEAGVIVLSGEDRRVLYENEIIKEFDKVREAIINSCEDELIYEFCDEEFELWYEVRDIKVPWVNGEQSDVYTVVDITNSKLQKKRAQYQENSDFLTGLYNRNRCEKDLQNEIDKAVESGQKGAILFMDLDDFKHINEGLGHQYGDVLLQAIAEGLRNIRNADGRCYRIGGDEFVILVPCEKYGDIEDIISDIKALFNESWDLMGAEHFCSVSTGVAIYPDNSTDVHDIIKMAGIAMYDARQSGKNQVSYYKGGSKYDFKKNYDIENNMRHAIATEIDEFVVFYQPVVDTFTRECTSCEALVRWNSKTLGFMGPGEFIPLAEYLGLITEIGDFVLEEACKQCRKWNDEVAPNLCVHVNLSVLQLLQKNAVENIRSIMESTGVNPKNIVLEITESFAINDMERVLEIVEGLKALGAGIALDDFGTGYSSLNYIKQLPLNIIKVDKTFIDDIVEDEYAQAFIKLIVELSKTIGTSIVVEGVEWQKQYDVLKGLGVNYIQGFLFGKPVNPSEFEMMHLRKGD